MTDIHKPVKKSKPSKEMRVQSGTCNSPSKNDSTGARKVLETITYPCPNCKRFFESEEDFSLHHDVRHAELGPLPKVTPIVKIKSKPPVETNQTERIPQSAHKKQRRSRINYKIYEESLEDTSTSSDSSESEEKDSDRKSSSTYTTDNNDDLVRQSHKKYRRKSKEHGKSNYDKTSSSSDDLDSDNGTDISETVKVIPKKSKVYKKRKHHKSNSSDSSDTSDSDSSSGDEEIKSLMLVVLKSSKTRCLLAKLLQSVEIEKERKLKRLQQQLTGKKRKWKANNNDYLKMYFNEQTGSNIESEKKSSDSDSVSSDSGTREGRKKINHRRMKKTKDRDDSGSRKRKSHPRSEGENENTDNPGKRRQT